MSAGDLRHRVTIEARAAGTDAKGQPNGAWAAITNGKNVPAKVEPVSSMRQGEVQRGRQMEANVQWLVKLRYRDGVTPKMRIKYDGHTLNILRAINPDGKKQWLECQCGETV